jgi:hypothetical protein
MPDYLTLTVWSDGNDVMVKCRKNQKVSLIMQHLSQKAGQQLVLIGDYHAIASDKKSSFLVGKELWTITYSSYLDQINGKIKSRNLPELYLVFYQI